MENKYITQQFVWIIGWLFTLGFLKLGVLKGFLAIFLWPYFLGASLSGVVV